MPNRLCIRRFGGVCTLRYVKCGFVEGRDSMRVPSDFHIPVTAPRSGVLEALGLKIGESVTAQVVGQNANGSTLVQIGNQQVSLNLPQNFPPGTELQFEVRGGGSKLELALLSTTAKPTTTVPNTAQQPQVVVSTSITNPGGHTGNAVTPPAAQPQPQTNQTAQQPPSHNSTYPRPPLAQPQAQTPQSILSQPPSPVPGATSVPQGQSAPTNAPVQSIVLPQQSTTTLNLTQGQTVTVQVAQPNAQGQAQIQIGGQTIPVTNASLPPAGTILQGHVAAHNGQLGISFQASRPGQAPYPTLSPSNAPTTASQTTTNSTGTSAPPSQIAHAPPAPNISQPLPAPNLSQVAADAVVRQDSIGKLIATITGLNNSAPKDLPSNITQLARAIADTPLRSEAQQLTADSLKDAVARSGVFMESALARGALPASGSQGDMKQMLMLLRNALGNWLDGDPLPQPKGQKPAPPMRGAPPRADGQTSQSLLPEGATAREAGRQLLAQTESALSRMRLFQLSSLPDAAQRGNPAATQELQFELPLMLGDQAAMAQFQVNRDGGNDSDPAQRGWHMSFAVHFNVIGAVGAKITFRARKTGVFVWAENAQTANVLEEMLPELVEGLEAQGLELSSVMVRHHTPEAAPPTNAGGYVDSVS